MNIKKNIVTIIIILGVAFSIVVILSRCQTKPIKPLNKNNSNITPRMTIPSLPARRMSGTFTVPAGKGPEETKVWIGRNEIVWIMANPSTKLLNCKNGRAKEIGLEGWISPPMKKKGYLTFLKGPKTTRVDYSIIN